MTRVGLRLVMAGLLAGAAALAEPKDDSLRRSLATQLVTDSARVRAGERVQLAGCPEDIALLEDLAVAVRKQGAHPLITLGSDRLTRRLYEEVPARFDSQPASFDRKLAETIDARIQTEFADDAALAGIAPERIEAVSRGNREVYALLRKRKVRLVWLGNGLYPSPSRARQSGLPLAELTRLFHEGLQADARTLQSAAEPLRRKLAAGKRVRLTAPGGTDLTLSIAARAVTVSDGVIRTGDKEGAAPPWTWLPAGEIFLVPLPASAEGTIVLDKYLYEGKMLRRLKFQVKNGRLSNLVIDNGGDALQDAFKAAEPGKEILSSLDIGVNGNVSLPAGCLLQTNVPAGMVTVGFGNNTWAGGDVKIPFALPLYIDRATLTVDGVAVVTDGKLQP